MLFRSGRDIYLRILKLYNKNTENRNTELIVSVACGGDVPPLPCETGLGFFSTVGFDMFGFDYCWSDI